MKIHELQCPPLSLANISPVDTRLFCRLLPYTLPIVELSWAISEYGIDFIGGRTRTRTLDPLIKSQLTERRVSPCTDALEIVLSRARSSSDEDFDGVSRCRYTPHRSRPPAFFQPYPYRRQLIQLERFPAVINEKMDFALRSGCHTGTALRRRDAPYGVRDGTLVCQYL